MMPMQYLPTVSMPTIPHIIPTVHRGDCFLNHYTHTDTSGALNRLTIPLSVIAGAYEPDIDTAINTYKTADTFTGADFIPDTRHLPHLEKPDEFVKVLMPLLS